MNTLRRRSSPITAACRGFLLLSTLTGAGNAVAETAGETFWSDVLAQSRMQLRVQGYLQSDQPVESVAEDRQDALRLQLRPDLWLRYGDATLTLRPRAEWSRNLSGEGRDEGEAYLNEGSLMLGLSDSLFVSYGRENLQWGPSQMLSPSNPFIQNNGRSNARLEVPGLEYARAVIVPSLAWSLSLIANTGEGAADFTEPFERSYAAKLDYTGQRYYLSLIASHRESEGSAGGFYAGVSASEGLLLYTEGEYDAEDRFSVLGGGSYTFERGSNLIVEYYHNGQGCTREPLAACLLPQPQVNPDRALLRDNYLLAQYTEPGLFDDKLDISLRWLRGIDDQSSRVTAYLNYDLNDNAEAFLWFSRNLGDAGSELHGALDYTLMAGVSLFF